MLFPLWVATLDYTYESEYPLDPNTLKPVVLSPQVRGVMNKEEWAYSYFKSAAPNKTAKKLGFLGNFSAYVPWIAIILVVIVAIYFNSKMSSLGATLDAVIGKLNSIAK